MILPKDIGTVRIGQPAKVDISAYDPAVYGSLNGRVMAISPDAVADERTGQTFYIVQVRTDSDRTGYRAQAGDRDGHDGRHQPSRRQALGPVVPADTDHATERIRLPRVAVGLFWRP